MMKRSPASSLAGLVDKLEESLVLRFESKEKVIRSCVEAFRTCCRLASSPLNILLPSKWRRRAVSSLRPRLGFLNHYPPREMRRLPDRTTLPLNFAPPAISIVTPSLNQSRFIDRTVRSVLDQNYPNLDYWIQDGASEDGTGEILEKWQDRLSGCVSEPDRGQADALNRAFARTRGELMAWLNADDMLLPGTLDCVADYFHRNPDVDVIYGNRLLIDSNDMEIGCWILPEHDDDVLSWADFVPQETLFWRRRIWERTGSRIDDSFRFAMDWDLLIRFRDAGAKFARVNRFLGAFRVHEDQKTSAAIGDIGRMEMNRIRERCLGRIPTQGEINVAVAPYVTRHLMRHFLHRLTGT